jgi:cytochrome c
MDSFELNKIIGAILGTLLFVMGVGFLAEAIYEPAHGSGPGYDLPAPAENEATTDNGAAAPAVADIGTLLAAADPKAGEAAAKKCQACHDFTKGGPNKTGPNLYGIVGEKIADVPGFAFSDALKAHASETWDYEKLNQWLISPKAFAPGTKMTYAGDKDDADRANIIAYLSTLSKSPVPFPPPAAPAGGQAPTSSQVQAGTSSVAPGDAVQTPATTDPNKTNAPGTGTTTNTPAGASSAEQTVAAPSSAASSAAASSEAAPAASSAPASSSAAQ